MVTSSARVLRRVCWHGVRLACSSMFRGPTVSARVWYQEMVGDRDTFQCEVRGWR